MNSTRIMYLCTKVYMCVWVVAMGKQIQTLNWQQWKKEMGCSNGETDSNPELAAVEEGIISFKLDKCKRQENE